MHNNRTSSIGIKTMKRDRQEITTAEYGVVKNVPYKAMATYKMGVHFANQTKGSCYELEKIKGNTKTIEEKILSLNSRINAKKKQSKIKAHNYEWIREWKKLKDLELSLDVKEEQETIFEREKYKNELFKHVNSPNKPKLNVEIGQRTKTFGIEADMIEQEINSLFSQAVEDDKALPLDADKEIETVLHELGLHMPREDDGLMLLINNFKNKFEIVFRTFNNNKIKKTSHNWNNEDHERYIKLYKQFYIISKTEKGVLFEERISFADLLKTNLPHKTEEEIKQHDRWYKTIYLIEQNKIRDSKQQLRNEVLNLRCQFRELTNLHLKLKELNEQKEKEKLKFEEHKNSVKKLLEEQLRVKEELLKEENEKLVKEEEKKRKIEENKTQIEKLRRENLKIQLQEYLKEKEEVTKRLQEEQKKEEEELRLKQELQQKYTKERVDFRKKEYLRQIEKQLQKQMERKEGEETKQERLNRLIDNVYKELRLNEISRDPKRLTQPTESTLQKLEEIEENLSFIPDIHGFSNDYLMKDTRFKLQTMLHDAGLLQSEYARSVLGATKPLKQPRTDTFTTYQLNQEK
ncbi:hypothetical protein ABK040_004514 [Willaertia magna]